MAPSELSSPKVATTPRVAFFTDTYAEINGVALTSRQLTTFAERWGYPFLCVRGADGDRRTQSGSVTHLEIRRGPLSFELDRGLRHDPILWRHQPLIAEAVRNFRPDIIHVVSPGDVSEIGVYLAKKLKLPLAISWHTNLHEFGAMRLEKLLHWSGDSIRKRVAAVSERGILNTTIWFYRLGDVLYAPNKELVDMLRERTGKPVFLMKRGIDTNLFTPARRTANDGILRLGYVGRITPEKSVRQLRNLEIELRRRGVPPFRFLIVGDGSEREWLQRNLEAADLPGILRGEPLADAYANMDVFVFPSRTDTFGNVVLEAFASGSPAVVTDAGGPKFIVEEGRTGFVAASEHEFIDRTARLLLDAQLRHQMGAAARAYACGESWDTVFERVYEGYRVGIDARQRAA
jgi:glycosyltransferase involved in cell wall biosynthesis